MQVNAVISSTVTEPGTQYGKKINTTISYLRQSQESKARALGIALNALTTNHFEDVKVNEIGITDFPTGTDLTLKRAADYRTIYLFYNNTENPAINCIVWSSNTPVEQTVTDPASGAPEGAKKQIRLDNVSTSYSTLPILVAVNATANFDSESIYTVIGEIESV